MGCRTFSGATGHLRRPHDRIGRRRPFGGQRPHRLGEARREEPRNQIVWVVRGTNLIRVYGGGLADQLPARGELGAHVKELVDSARVTLIPGFSTTAVRRYGEQVILEGETADGPRTLQPVDRVIVATGQRPDLSLTRELRLRAPRPSDR